MAHHFCRRRFLSVAGAGVTLAGASRLFAATEFWNAGDPSRWTEDEIRILTSKSPWARAAVPTYKNTDDPTGTSGGRGGRGFRLVADSIIVRWESAQPILDALRAPLPADFNGHYVISVTNLPDASPRPRGRGDEPANDDALDRLQNGATLTVKGRDPAEAGIVRRTRIGSILFGFAKDTLPLTSANRDIFFRLDTGQLNLQAKFDGKDMIYHGKLAV